MDPEWHRCLQRLRQPPPASSWSERSSYLRGLLACLGGKAHAGSSPPKAAAIPSTSPAKISSAPAAVIRVPRPASGDSRFSAPMAAQLHASSGNPYPSISANSADAHSAISPVCAIQISIPSEGAVTQGPKVSPDLKSRAAAPPSDPLLPLRGLECRRGQPGSVDVDPNGRLSCSGRA